VLENRLSNEVRPMNYHFSIGKMKQSPSPHFRSGGSRFGIIQQPKMLVYGGEDGNMPYDHTSST